MSKGSFQLKSMTAYGRGTASSPEGTFTVEIQSVNRRHLEVHLNLPKLLTRFEMPLRKQIQERVGRGMINVYVGWRSEGGNPVKVTPNLSLAKGIKSAWEQILFELGLEGRIDLALLAKEEGLILIDEALPEESRLFDTLNTALAEALDHFVAMKEREGKSLAHDLHERIITLIGVIEMVASLAPEGVEKVRRKLNERLEELFSGNSENEERILREVALYAERSDITEEVTRFKSHLEQFRYLLEKPLTECTETRGKTLDFLIQELNREINTIGSKASDLTITNQVVKAKGEIEKMREQVQNIE